MHGQKIGGVVQLPNQLQLMSQQITNLGVDVRTITLPRPDPGQLFQFLLRCPPLRHRFSGVFIA